MIGTYEVGRIKLLRSSRCSVRRAITSSAVRHRRIDSASDDAALSLKHLLLLLS